MGFVFNFIKFFNELLTLPFDISIRIFGQKLFANTPDRILALFFWKFKILIDNYQPSVAFLYWSAK